MLRKSQAQFREKLRKLRLSQNNGYLTKKRGQKYSGGNFSSRILARTANIAKVQNE